MADKGLGVCGGGGGGGGGGGVVGGGGVGVGVCCVVEGVCVVGEVGGTD